MKSDLAEVREMVKIERSEAEMALNRSSTESQVQSLQAQREQQALMLSDLRKSLLRTNEQRENLAKEAESLRETLIQLKKLHVERTESTRRDLENAEKSKKDLEARLQSLLCDKSDVNSVLSMQVKTLSEQFSGLERKYEGELRLQRELESNLRTVKERKQLQSWEKRVLQTTQQIQTLSTQLDQSLEQRKSKARGPDRAG